MVGVPDLVFFSVACGFLLVTEVGFAVAKHQDETPETLLEARSGGRLSPGAGFDRVAANAC